MIRKILPDQILPDIESKWRAVIARIKAMHAQGRPVLVGTRSVAASEHLSILVAAAGLPRQVLNAKQDGEEAEIISRAGESGRITIATNMAGRGTDIKLGKGVKELGGLYVIATERHEAARIDRQLAGRGGRQGDPGTFEAILSLEDPLLESGRGGLIGVFVKKAIVFPDALRKRLSRRVILRAQKRIEHYHLRIRKELFRQDQQQGSLLSFSGRLE
jgi:preprotein translocase subunit SecA